MRYDPNQHRAFIGGIWLIGFGILFATRAWWPGIMFVIGITAIIEGWLRRQPWYGMQAGFWSILIGVWALTPVQPGRPLYWSGDQRDRGSPGQAEPVLKARADPR